MALLTAHDWPGNIRELENAIHRAIVLSDGKQLTCDLFPQIAAQLPGYKLGPADGSGEMGLVAIDTARPVNLSCRDAGPNAVDGQANDEAADPQPAPSMEPAYPAVSAITPDGEVRRIAEMEEELIRFALLFYGGQMSEVARRLGIGRSTLYRKLKDYAIDPDHPNREAA